MYAPLIDQPNQPKEKPALTTRDIIELNSFWFGYQFFWFLISIVLLPNQVQEIQGQESKGIGLGFISLISGLVFLFLSPVVGTLNDTGFFVPIPRATDSILFGKRKYYMLFGTLGMCFNLFLMSGQDSLWFYTFAYLGLNVSSIICSVPFNGLVSDITPSHQNGKVSNIMGAMNLFGYLFGALVGIGASSVHLYVLYIFMTLVFIGCTWLTIVSTRESCTNPKTNEPIIWSSLPREIITPLIDHRNFRLVFISRFLFQLGIATIQSFLQYWITDCINTDMDATTAVSVAMIPNLFLAPIAALCTPNTGRKKVVFFAASLMGLSSILMMASSQFSAALLVSGIFGIGFGPFMTVEFAMLMDVLPSQKDAARDMSVWHTALILPQIVAVPIAGIFVDFFQLMGKSEGIHCLGYKVIDIFTVVYFIFGSLVTNLIQGLA